MIKVIKKVDNDFLRDFVYRINLEDKNLYTVLESSPLGVFQFSGNTAEGVTKRVKPETFEDIVAINGFARPGTIDFLPQYLENKAKGTSSYPEKVHNLLKDTHGTMIFQEQAMNVFNKIGGLSLEKTNNLRGLMKRLSKADKRPEDLKAWDEAIAEFEQGAKNNGLSSMDAKKIADDMLLMSSYSFNLSHAVAYSYNAVITMYLTYYFRKYFYSTIIEYTMDKDRDDVPNILKQIRSYGYHIYPPNINKSKTKTYVEDNDIYIGLRNVKQVGDEVADSIVSNAPYTSFFEFLIKNLENPKLNKRAISSLVKFGVFDVIEKSLNRKQMVLAFDSFWETKKSFSKPLREEVEKNKNVEHLIANNKEVSSLYSIWSTSKNKWENESFVIPDMSYLKELEFETTGFNFFISPFSSKEMGVFEEGNERGLLKISFQDLENNTSWRVPVFINKIRTLKDKNGNEMAFVEIEDTTGETVSIPVFASFWPYLTDKLFEKTICLMILYRNSSDQIMLGVDKFIRDQNLISKFVVPVRNVYG